MEKFTRITGIAASFPRVDIDTDAVIPAQWMRTASMAALGRGLFGGWRYDESGAEKPDFILNRPPFREAKIIVAGPNFGCGSSREAAVWALQRFGIRCVVASSFGDIFHENAFKNGLLPLTLPQAEVEALLSFLAATNDPTLTVDLESCVVETPSGQRIPFVIPEARRRALLDGADEIAHSLEHAAALDAFVARDRADRPWIHARPAGLVARARS